MVVLVATGDGFGNKGSVGAAAGGDDDDKDACCGCNNAAVVVVVVGTTATSDAAEAVVTTVAGARGGSCGTVLLSMISSSSNNDDDDSESFLDMNERFIILEKFVVVYNCNLYRRIINQIKSTSDFSVYVHTRIIIFKSNICLK